MPAILEQRVFLPTKPFARSIDFYSRLGWENIYKDDNLALMKFGASMFFLQNAYVEDWANNLMIHLVVDDTQAWCDTVTRVKTEGGFDEVRVRAPLREPYGATATHVIDPAGVLLFFAQFD